MEVASQPQDPQQVAEGATITFCNAPDPTEAKSEAKAAEVEVADKDACHAVPETNCPAVSEEAKPDETTEADAPSTEKEEAKTEPAEENAPEKAESDPVPKSKQHLISNFGFDQFYRLASEEINENDASLEEVTIIKQKRKFDEIQDDSTAEETVAKKIKFEE